MGLMSAAQAMQTDSPQSTSESALNDGSAPNHQEHGPCPIAGDSNQEKQVEHRDSMSSAQAIQTDIPQSTSESAVNDGSAANHQEHGPYPPANMEESEEDWDVRSVSQPTQTDIPQITSESAVNEGSAGGGKSKSSNSRTKRKR